MGNYLRAVAAPVCLRPERMVLRTHGGPGMDIADHPLRKIATSVPLAERDGFAMTV